MANRRTRKRGGSPSKPTLKRPVIRVSKLSKKNREIVKHLKTLKSKTPCSTIDGETLESLLDEVDEGNKKVWKMLRKEQRNRQNAGESIFDAINRGEASESGSESGSESEDSVNPTMDSPVRDYIQGFNKESQQDVIQTIKDVFPPAKAMDDNIILNMILYKDIIRLSGDSLDFMDRYHGSDESLSSSE